MNDQYGAPPQNGTMPPVPQTPAPGNDSPAPEMEAGGGDDTGGENEEVAKVLWDRANKLQPQDLQVLSKALNRQAGLILLKLVPELSGLLLEGEQMQGPEMGEVRGSFGHDQLMQQMGGGGAPQGPTQGPASMPPTGRAAGGLRNI